MLSIGISGVALTFPENKMPTDSDGQHPEQVPSSSNLGNDGSGSSGRRRDRRKKRGPGNNSKSKQPSHPVQELKHFYYEIPGVDWTLPPFREVTRAIINYFVSTRTTNASEYLELAETKNFQSIKLGEPAQPSADATDEEKFIWREQYKRWMNKSDQREGNNAALFGLLLRQCSPQFEQAIREHANWMSASVNKDPVELLIIIQYVSASGGATNVDPFMMQVQSQQRYFSFRQKEGMSNAEYYARFMHNANTSKFCKSALGASLDNLKEACRKKGIVSPTLEELEAKENDAREREMAMLFLINSDKK